MRWNTICLILAISFFVPINVLRARSIPDRDLAKLFAESDLVLIVEVGETREATSTDAISSDPDIDSSLLEPVFTTLNIQFVVKGEYKPTVLDFCHYRLRRRANENGLSPGYLNGPHLLQLEKSPKIIHIDGGSKEVDLAYLIFLKRRADDILIPVTGFYDSSFSARPVVDGLP